MSIESLPNMQAGAVSRDFQAIYADLKRMIPQVAPEWTYYGDDDFGAVLLQFAAYLADQLHYRNDATMRDMVPTRSPHREVVREFAEWLGYMARRATAAEVDLTFTVPAALPEALPLPRGLQVEGSGPSGTVIFELSDAVVLEAGRLSVSAHAVEGVTRSSVLLGTSTGSFYERFVIQDLDCIYNWTDEDLVVTVGDTEAIHFKYPALLTPNVLGYWVRQGVDGHLEIRFGDGTFGSTLPASSAVRCTYRRGGGVAGNVGAGALSTVVNTQRLVDGTPVDLSVTNASGAAPGFDLESIESIRSLAPANFRAQERAVTESDYATMALRVPGVYQARITPTGVNGVVIALVPTGLQDGIRVTQTLINRVVRAIDPVRMATDCVTAKAARLVPVDVHLSVRARRNSRSGAVAEAVRQRFIGNNGMFTETANMLGRTLWFSDMVGDIESVSSVDNLDVLRYCRRPTLRWTSASGDAALTALGVTISVTTRPQTWTVTFLDGAQFVVTGSISGAIETVGQLDQLFSVPGEISFTLASGVGAMAEGDWGEIVVGALVGNISLAADEFPIFDARSVYVKVFGGIGA